LVAELTDEEWRSESACSGWTNGEVAAHCTLGDHFWRTNWGVFTGLLRLQSSGQWTVQTQNKWAGEGPEAVSRRLREDRVSFLFRLGPYWLRLLSYAEQLLHSEDIRRPLGKARAAAPDDDVVWALVQVLSRYLKKVRGSGILLLDGGEGRALLLELRAGKRPRAAPAETRADAVLRGAPLELAFFLAGRRSDILIEGEGELVRALRDAELKYF
jgi:uncharacterized protein (TIGR03083 family)